MADFRRVLIVKLSALGDVLHALPAVPYLLRAAPGTEIHWAVDRRFADLLQGNPGISKVIPLPIREWKGRIGSVGTWREALAAAKALRDGRYDAAFDVQGNLKSGVVAFLSGAPLRYGFDRAGAREAPNLVFTNRKVPSREEDRHVIRKILRVVSAPFGGEFDLASLRAEIVPSESEARTADRIVSGIFPSAAPILVVHPGSTWETKKMDPDFWVRTVRLLKGRLPGMGVLLSWGNPEERAEADGIARAIGEGTALLPPLTLRELAAVYRRCGHLMAPDTGPLHVAAAAGARTVSVFRATDGNRNAPPWPGHRFLQAPLPCTACLRRRCERDAECRRAIAPEAAAEAVAATLEGAA